VSKKVGSEAKKTGWGFTKKKKNVAQGFLQKKREKRPKGKESLVCEKRAVNRLVLRKGGKGEKFHASATKRKKGRGKEEVWGKFQCVKGRS